jgi:hypothetical protein
MADRKVWLMEDVNPWEYETVNGEKRMKDWAQGEFEARLAKPAPEDVASDEQKIAERRRMSASLRGHTLTPEQVRQAEESFLDAQRRASALAVGLALPPA